MIADRGFASQVDADDILSLGGIEGIEHDIEQAVRMRAK
jgi:hypothetical protein